MRLRVVANAGMVLGIMLVASVAFASYPDEGFGRGTTETWVMNVHETLDANVVASFFDRDGQQTWSIESTIDPLGNDSFPASSSELPSGWLGSMSLDSLRPVASIAETIWQDVPQGDGWSATTVNDTGEGAQEIFFPSIAKTSVHRSRLTIQCLDAEECLVSMTYRDRDDGDTVPGSPFVETIQPFSQETYDLWDPSVNAHVPDDSQMPSGWFGSLEVTSSQEIAGVALRHSNPGYASAYNAVPRSTEAEVFFPSVVRRNFGSWGGQSDWSDLNVLNLNDVGITVYLNFYDDDSGERVLRFSDVIPAYGSHNYNTRYVGEFPLDDLGNGFIGSAVVTSSLPIVGSGGIIRAPSDKSSGAYSGLSAGYNKLVFPVAYRIKEGSAWLHYSGITIQNLDPENEIDVHLEWMDSDGDVLLEFNDYDIPPYAAHGYNTRYSTDQSYGNLLTNWKGTVVVTTDSPLGIAGVILNQSTLVGYGYISQYNGVTVH